MMFIIEERNKKNSYLINSYLLSKIISNDNLENIGKDIFIYGNITINVSNSEILSFNTQNSSKINVIKNNNDNNIVHNVEFYGLSDLAINKIKKEIDYLIIHNKNYYKIIDLKNNIKDNLFSFSLIKIKTDSKI